MYICPLTVETCRHGSLIQLKQFDIGPTAEASAGVTLHNLWPRRHLLPWRNQSSETQAWSIEQLLLQHLKSQKARRG
jgi:hypothetical protein